MAFTLQFLSGSEKPGGLTAAPSLLLEPWVQVGSQRGGGVLSAPLGLTRQEQRQVTEPHQFSQSLPRICSASA